MYRYMGGTTYEEVDVERLTEIAPNSRRDIKRS